MIVTFYQNNSPKNVVNKSIQEVAQKDGQLKDGCSFINPRILFSGQPNAYVNYVYVNRFFRFYYVDDINIINGNLYELVLHCDVLKSFAGGLKGCTGYVTNAGQGYGLDLINGGTNPPGGDIIETFGYDLTAQNFVPDGGMFVLTIAG